MSLQFFVDSGHWFHFKLPEKKVSFNQQLFCEMRALI